MIPTGQHCITVHRILQILTLPTTALGADSESIDTEFFVAAFTIRSLTARGDHVGQSVDRGNFVMSTPAVAQALCQ
jgi:hypothetical protein